jgi:SAM-dependent methyltransferase
MRASRSKPRIWDADWLVLAPLSQLIANQAKNFIPPTAEIVDFGCGDMPYKNIFQRLGIKYVGADITDDADLLIDAAGQIPLSSGTADAVLSVQVLEHVRDLDLYCGEIWRLLKRDGTLLLSTHGSWLYHPHPEDHRRWTRPGLVNELESRGFTVDQVIPIAGPLATTTILRLTGFVFFLKKIPVLGRLMSAALSTIMNIRALLEDAITPKNVIQDNACVYFVRARKKST